jgi:RND family efflux transporter MFP subunit
MQAKKAAMLAYAAGVALTAAGCGTARSEKTAETVEPPSVAVAKASARDLNQTLVLTAEFKPYQEVDVMAKVAGYVKAINVDIGDRVKTGELLATLEIPEMADELDKARASLRRSQAEVAQAKDEVQRAESGHQVAHLSFTRFSQVMKTRPGLVAQQEVDDAQGKDAVSEAQVSAAKSNLAAAEQQVSVANAELARLQTLYGYTKVTAPFDSVVTKRFADTGAMIQAGTASQTQAMPVVRLSQNSLLRLILPVPESAVPTVHAGQPVDVRVRTLNRTFPGKVVRFADRVATSTRTMDTEVDVPNPGLMLVPGMYAEVDLVLKEANRALSVPVNAVDTNAEKESAGSVMLVDAQNHLQRREVTLGIETSNRIEVRDGLTEGDLVVVGNRAGLQTGELVKPKITELTAEK